MQIDRERLVLVCAGALTGSAASAKLIDRRAVDAILADIEAQGFVVVPREKLARIRSSMTLLLNNSQGCALNHYGDDAATLGLPGWLEDCRKDVLDFTAMIDAGKGEG